MNLNKDVSKARFCALSEVRLAEAISLMASGQYSGAYYLGGYAVECALKAIIASSFQENTIPDMDRVKKTYVHSLKDLVGVAGLQEKLQEARTGSAQFQKNWTLVVEWNERARYAIWNEDDARDLISALAGEPDGVLPWLKNFW